MVGVEMMWVNQARNVCEALPRTVEYITHYGVEENSRAGPVRVAPHPIMTITKYPRERVLFSAARDANPIFHLAEAIWMLAGRYDAKFLDRFVRDFSSRYAEPDGALHDAYGFRWRHGFGFDQLDQVVDKLVLNQFDRQAVIQMWDAGGTFDDLRGDWKSRPCNTHCYLRINDHKLDLTICCRSNDMFWGAHGANAVHFSILQEYLAARIDVDMGSMYQLSNNAHIYTKAMEEMHITNSESLVDNRYYTETIMPIVMFEEPECIDDDIKQFMQNLEDENLKDNSYANDWFHNTLSMAVLAHNQFKLKHYESAIEIAYEIEAHDWRIASVEWIERRAK
jgi:thymidylate synthase